MLCQVSLRATDLDSNDDDNKSVKHDDAEADKYDDTTVMSARV